MMNDSKNISLFINTACKSLEIAVDIDGELFIKDLGDPKKSLENTNLGIKALLSEHGLALKDVNAYYCLLGPGSNTGIRLGLTIPRTVYAFNPEIRLYGIETMKLMNQVSPYAALSDRNGNLFIGEKKDGEYVYARTDKADIPSLPYFEEIAVEDSDNLALTELEGQNVRKVRIITMMAEHRDAFRDYSDDEEHYLPEYTMKI